MAALKPKPMDIELGSDGDIHSDLFPGSGYSVGMASTRPKYSGKFESEEGKRRLFQDLFWSDDNERGLFSIYSEKSDVGDDAYLDAFRLHSRYGDFLESRPFDHGTFDFYQALNTVERFLANTLKYFPDIFVTLGMGGSRNPSSLSIISPYDVRVIVGRMTNMRVSATYPIAVKRYSEKDGGTRTIPLSHSVILHNQDWVMVDPPMYDVVRGVQVGYVVRRFGTALYEEVDKSRAASIVDALKPKHLASGDEKEKNILNRVSRFHLVLKTKIPGPDSLKFSRLALTEEDDFVIFSSNSFWDQVADVRDVINIVKSNSNPSVAAQALVKYAKANNSGDSPHLEITVVVVFIGSLNEGFRQTADDEKYVQGKTKQREYQEISKNLLPKKLIDTIQDFFEAKSDEALKEVLTQEISKLQYISTLSRSAHTQEGPEIDSKDCLFYFNDKDESFEFYFEDCQHMASVVGVGLEYAKVITEDGRLLKVQEISEGDYNSVWKNFDSSSSWTVTTIPRSPVPSISSGSDLLFDIAKHFILSKALLTLANSNILPAQTSAASSSNAEYSSQGTSASSSSSDGSNVLKWLGSLLEWKGSSGQTKGKGGDPPGSFPSADETKKTTVSLQLLHGGYLYTMTRGSRSPLGPQVVPEEYGSHEQLLLKQLDDCISTDMEFTFIDDPYNGKEIEVTVGPVGFLFSDECTQNYETYRRHGWYHQTLDVSFAVGKSAHARIVLDGHKPLRTTEAKITDTSGSSTVKGTAKQLGITAGVLHPLKIEGTIGATTQTNDTCTVGSSDERVVAEIDTDFRIYPEVLVNGKVKCVVRYEGHNIMSKIDNCTLSQMGADAYLKPIFTYKVVAFESKWRPSASVESAKYTFTASREVQMTNKEPSKDLAKKKLRHVQFRTQRKAKGGTSEDGALLFTQVRKKDLILNHSLTNLGSGTKYLLEERCDAGVTSQSTDTTRLEVIGRGIDSGLVQNYSE